MRLKNFGPNPNISVAPSTSREGNAFKWRLSRLWRDLSESRPVLARLKSLDQTKFQSRELLCESVLCCDLTFDAEFLLYAVISIANRSGEKVTKIRMASTFKSGLYFSEIPAE